MRVPASIALTFTAAAVWVACENQLSEPQRDGLSEVPELAARPPAPHTSALDDDPAQRVRSDGRGTYVNAEECVSISIGSGFYQLRPVANSQECNAQTWRTPQWSPTESGRRYATLVFSDTIVADPNPARGWDMDSLDVPGGPGDADGPEVEQAAVRFIARDLFTRKATQTSVEILVQQVRSNGTTTQEAQWQIVYDDPAPIMVAGDARSIALGTGGAAAQVNEVTGRTANGTYIIVPRGKYDLPFHLTATDAR